jgi:acetolactate decarboxylase
MLTRRQLLHTSLVTGCGVCAALATNRLFAASATDAAVPSTIDAPGYSLSFIGSQRQTIMTGDRAAHLDLQTLKGRPHLYGIGPIQGLTGEVTIADSRPSLARVGADHLVHVTESFEAGVPFFVWAEVPAWQTQDMPDLPTYANVESFVGQAGAKAGLTQAFPFVMTGRPELIDFHIVNATPDTPPGMEAHQKIQIPFGLRGQDVKLVGFWSSQHQGVFTPMGTNIHTHFQTLDNKVSGHVQGLKLARGMTMSLPKG